nr:glycosyltransferase family 2 protein [Salinibacter ruber]
MSELPDPPPGKTGWPWTEQSDVLPETQPDGTSWPKISIVTPSYNQGEFVKETIRSVLLQGYPNLEYIVVDGVSTDETVSTLEKYDSWIDDWVSEPDRGQSHAINKGFRKASGVILGWLNSDDYLAPDALRHMAGAFHRAGSEVGAIVGVGHKINRTGEIVYTPDISEPSFEAFLDWMGEGNFMQPACFFRRQAWKECGPLREDLKYPMDVDLWLKIAREYDFGRVDETIAYAYEHEGAKTTGERPRMRAETIKLIVEHGGREVAWRELDRMAEDLADAHQKIDYIKSTSLYRYVIGPLYRAFWRE